MNDKIEVDCPRIKTKSNQGLASNSNWEVHLDKRVGLIRLLENPAPLPLWLSKPLSLHFTLLKDLHNFVGKEVSLLCMVGKISEPVQVQTRDSTKSLTKITLSCFDQDCPRFPLSFWEDDIQLLNGLKEHDTILFVQNLRITTYSNMLHGSFTFASCLYRDPWFLPAARGLRQWFAEQERSQNLYKPTNTNASITDAQHREIQGFLDANISSGMATSGFVSYFFRLKI